MILAEKIAKLRKQNGWSQEELAEKLDVSRQAVAKWEGAQSAPNLDKILQLGEIFGVTTDYLLKDEIESEEYTENGDDDGVIHVTLAEANEFLEHHRQASVKIAAAVFMCIVSAIPLILLSTASECYPRLISELFAVAVGIGMLLVTVACAVMIFVFCGFQNKPYEFLDKDFFITDYGVRGMVSERQREYRDTYVRYNMIGVCVCIISPIPLIAGSLSNNEFLIVLMLAATMIIAGIGVMFFVIAGVRWSSMQKLLKEGEFAPREKEKSKIKESIGSVYWLAVTAIYLAWSFIADSWRISWVVWVIAGVLFAGVMTICDIVIDKNR